ncbi:hypothetical protein BMS3Bbin16_01144 [archaeon BMS3Bbin16]|nr:hypothetical protein BMS3Bbin16_01144 [archaeon BMS3Bbin16]
MGVSLVAAVAILSIVGLVAFNSLFIQMNNYAEKVIVPMEKKSRILEEQMKIDLEIVNVTIGGGASIYAENTGSATINPQDVFLSVNGAFVPEASYSFAGLGYFTKSTGSQTVDVYNSSNSSQVIGFFNQNVTTSQFVETNSSDQFYWNPSEVILIKTSYGSPGSGDRVRVIYGETFDEYRIE